MSVEVADRLRCHCAKCIDFHTHFLQREVFETTHSHSVSSCFGQNMLSPELPSFQRMFQPELQIADMDARGIDVNILTSCDVVQSRAWATPDDERRMTALVNEECARWVDAHPMRFMGTTVMPMGDMKMALAELDWAASVGFKIVQLPSNYRGEYLGTARFTDLWAAIEARGLVAFIHPEGVTDMWFQNYALWNSIGQSIEEVKCMSSLIYEGVMDRFPALKIVMAHGGGYMPHYMGRLDRNVTDKPFTTKNISKKPSDYLKDFYYDSCVYDPRTLELLVERVGIDRVVLGGDYPVAALDPIDFLDSATLSDIDRAKIAGGNAHRLLELDM
jgi:aminocarboxymuconate-semialdehyde decarboxylase